MRRVRSWVRSWWFGGLLLAAVTPPAHALVWPDRADRIEEAARSTDVAARESAARAAASLGRGRGGPLLLTLLQDSAVNVRMAAAPTAAALRLSEATDLILPWFAERDAAMRVAAAQFFEVMPDGRATSALSRALSDSDVNVRLATIRALGASASPEATAALLTKLDDNVPAVRVEVARALTRLGDERAVVPLMGKVQDSAPEVRQAIARALGQLGDPRATPALALLVRDPHQDTRVEAVSALAQVPSPTAVELAQPLVQDRVPAVRQAAIAALGRNPAREAGDVLLRALGTGDDAGGGLDATPLRRSLVERARAAPESIARLLAEVIATHDAVRSRESAAWILGDLGHVDGTGPGSSDESDTRVVAALRKGLLGPPFALRALQHPSSLPVALEFLGDSLSSVRSEAQRAAARLLRLGAPDGRAVDPLVARIEAPGVSLEERLTLAELLGATRSPRAARPLLGLLAAPGSRGAALDALGRIGSPDADDALVDELRKYDSAHHLTAAQALRRGGGSKALVRILDALRGGEELDREATFLALSGLMRHLPALRSARQAAGEVFREASLAERDAMLEGLSRSSEEEAETCLKDLIAAAGEPLDAPQRWTVASAWSGGTLPSEAQRARLRDGDVRVRAQAAWALGSRPVEGTREPLLTLATQTQDADSAINATAALARIARPNDEPLSRAFCTLLDHPHPWVRSNALRGLRATAKRCGDGGIERKLAQTDPDLHVRMAAMEQLGAMPADVRAKNECVARERNIRLRELCRGFAARRVPGPTPEPLLVYVVKDRGRAAPFSSYALEMGDGLIRVGVTDRRGAVVDPRPAAGLVQLIQVR